MSPSNVDPIQQLQQQVEKLMKEVAQKQNAVVGEDESGKPMDVRMCITLLESKIKRVESRVMDLHNEVKAHAVQFIQLEQRISEQLNGFGGMMKDMHSIITRNKTEPPQRENPHPAMLQSTTTGVGNSATQRLTPRAPIQMDDVFDYKQNTKILIFGISEPLESDMLQQGDTNTNQNGYKTTTTRPTVRDQLLKGLREAGVDCGTLTIGTVKRIGLFDANARKPRPIFINFGDVSSANEFMKEKTSLLRSAGLAAKWWRPAHMRKRRHTGTKAWKVQPGDCTSQWGSDIADLKMQVDNLTRLLAVNKERAMTNLANVQYRPRADYQSSAQQLQHRFEVKTKGVHASPEDNASAQAKKIVGLGSGDAGCSDKVGAAIGHESRTINSRARTVGYPNLLQKRRKCIVAALNIRTARKEGQMHGIAELMERKKLDVLIISESQCALPDNVGNSTVVNASSSGTKLVLSPIATSCLISWTKHHDRIVSCRFYNRHFKITITGVYWPANNRNNPPEHYSTFSDRLGKVISGVSQRDMLIIGGDFNCTGYSYELLQKIVEMNDICIGQWDKFKHLANRPTWKHPNKQLGGNVLDLILIRRRYINMLEAMGVTDPDPIETDHKLVWGRMGLHLNNATSRRKEILDRERVQKLITDPRCQKVFDVKLSDSYANSRTQNDPNEAWNELQEQIKGALEAARQIDEEGGGAPQRKTRKQKRASKTRQIERMTELRPNDEKAIWNVLQETLKVDSSVDASQTAFRAGRSGLEIVHAIQLLIDKCKLYDLPLTLTSIDFRKAFDRISRSHVYESLRMAGVHPKYVRIIRNCYESAKASIRISSKERIIPLDRGLRQGDCWSPILFICSLDRVLSERLRNSPHGFRLLDTNKQPRRLTRSHIGRQKMDDVTLPSSTAMGNTKHISYVREDGEAANLVIAPEKYSHNNKKQITERIKAAGQRMARLRAVAAIHQ
ncbi:conserved hypothetical protein [Perkinsus marinus ATCC 50983]|uniref:Reverse transcriptase domain-containing protein n=1 Tax=Perkinsus marinus (strain ATCC 50983 / TXsc) TaxID=423536 RepID=C5KEQ3_PERM5|nr:conserved hypothetical protein [Perkinsus marinus ATCC 50983]EER17041.1 conserved hypothetical protein [Perkinsus marinus ATCC 50983]|eukprot:XP_002785245.1 conserved hypothetical protein [Perkinsus marinus ATCC 50983]